MILTSENIDKLWKHFAKNHDEKTKLQLVDYYYDFVKKIAFKVSAKMKWKASPEYLTSFGIDGLYSAIGSFDPSHNVKFESFAKIRIRGSMLDGLRKEDYVPRTVRANNTKFEKTKQKLQSEKKEQVIEDEVFNELDVDNKSYYKCIKKFTPTFISSLDNISGDKGQDNETSDTELYRLVKDKQVKQPEDKIFKQEFFTKLVGDGFSLNEQKIIYFYYYQSLTMDQVAKKISLSESRVSQMHKNILHRLKEKIKKNPEYFQS